MNRKKSTSEQLMVNILAKSKQPLTLNEIVSEILSINPSALSGNTPCKSLYSVIYRREKRRAEVLEGSGRMSKVGPLKVIAYFGDAMGDFPKQSEKDFGETNFILPNPMYGKW